MIGRPIEKGGKNEKSMLKSRNIFSVYEQGDEEEEEEKEEEEEEELKEELREDLKKEEHIEPTKSVPEVAAEIDDSGVNNSVMEQGALDPELQAKLEKLQNDITELDIKAEVLKGPGIRLQTV